jgi:predicted HTH domain antitoxin
MELTVNIPESITNLKPVSEKDIVLALVIQMYIDEEVSLGKAAEIAGMTRFEFQKLMADKDIPMRYGIEDLERELETVQKFLSDNRK